MLRRSFLRGWMRSDMRFRLLVALLLPPGLSQATEIRGKVTNAVGGEALGRVEVVVLGTKFSAITSVAGKFTISNLPPGSYTLRLNAVSYRLLEPHYQFTFMANWNWRGS